jgi:GTP pyrophosphokinase
MAIKETGSESANAIKEPVSRVREKKSSPQGKVGSSPPGTGTAQADPSGKLSGAAAPIDPVLQSSTQAAGEAAPEANGRDGRESPQGQDGAAASPSVEKAALPPKHDAYPAGFIRQYELVDRVCAYDPHCDEDMLNRAYVFSMRAHGEQKRSSGDPYFTHPISVAAILTELKADPETIVTALLHDTVEDTSATLVDIERLFGTSVATLVDGVTKLSKVEMRSEATKQAENFRKFVLAMSKDVRVLLVKLADRLHNMQTLHYIPKEEKRRRIALETMQIYAPLAGRIGVQKFRDDLENLSFKFLNPDGYELISTNLGKLRDDTVHSVVALAQTLRGEMDARGVKAEVHSREKRPFSIWRKMQRKGHAFEELADIYAFRIIVETVDDCYKALGAIHQAFPMIPDEFDDYVSTPKPNNYRSLHTAVLAPVDKTGIRQRVEVQIRTKEMHESAERGIAAHWRYKDASAQATSKVIEITNSDNYDPYAWARNAVEMLQQGDDASEFLEHAKMELFQDQVFCFTPKGRVIALPQGATPIDFAYALHTDIGESCVGARINGLTRPLRTPLRNGDIVRVLRSENAPIPENWESMVVTGRARSGIRRRVKALKRAEQLKLGQRILASEFSAHGLPLSPSEDIAGIALKKLGFKSVEDVQVAVGALELSAKAVRLATFPGMEELAGAEAETARKPLRPAGAVHLEGLTRGVTVKMSTCCSPLPGERIIGLPEEGGRVAVHRIDCEELGRTSIPEDDWIDLRWRDGMEGEFVAPIIVTVNNRAGALAHVATMLARYGSDISYIKMGQRNLEFGDMILDITVKSARHLANVLTGLRTSEHVLSAQRRFEQQETDDEQRD